MVLKLTAEKRDLSLNANKVRKTGKIPAVFYGGPKVESTPILVNQREFEKVWKEAGESSIISLEGVGEEKEVLIHDVDIDPVKGNPRHADFYVIEKGKKIEVSIPLEFIGVSPAVKELNGMLVKVMYEIEINVLPKDLPQNIEVDISTLEDFESRIIVKDLKLPQGVEVLNELEETVASVSQAKEEEPEEVAPEADLSEIEVEKKGKEDSSEEGEKPVEEKQEKKEE